MGERVEHLDLRRLTASVGLRVDVPLVFVDTETTDLAPAGEPWEIYLQRREVDGRCRSLHLFVEYSEETAGWLEMELPQRMREDRARRFPEARKRGQVRSRAEAVGEIAAFIEGPVEGGTLVAPWERPHLVGINPAFDADMIGQMFYDSGLDVPWSHHMVDVSLVAFGVLAGLVGAPVGVPWNSDDLARALGLERPEGRHTAQVDALMARDMWDRCVEMAGWARGERMGAGS